MITFAIKTESDNEMIMQRLIRHFMKTIVAFSLLLAVGVAQAGYAQTIRNNSNSMIAKIESDGTVRNSSNSYIGRIYSDGDIRDGSNRLLGKLCSNGDVRDSSNSYMGKIESDGTVRNSSNSVIGYAKDVPVRYAALYFFFDFFD